MSTVQLENALLVLGPLFTRTAFRDIVEAGPEPAPQITVFSKSTDRMETFAPFETVNVPFIVVVGPINVNVFAVETATLLE